MHLKIGFTHDITWNSLSDVMFQLFHLLNNRFVYVGKRFEVVSEVMIHSVQLNCFCWDSCLLLIRQDEDANCEFITTIKLFYKLTSEA